MQHSAAPLLHVAIVVATLSSALALYSSGGPVQILSKKNFKAQVIDTDLPALVEFYAPWCALASSDGSCSVKVQGTVLLGSCRARLRSLLKSIHLQGARRCLSKQEYKERVVPHFSGVICFTAGVGTARPWRLRSPKWRRTCRCALSACAVLRPSSLTDSAFSRAVCSAGLHAI